MSPLPRRACLLHPSLSSTATAWYCHGERLSASAPSTQRTPRTSRKVRSGQTLTKTPESINTPPMVRRKRGVMSRYSTWITSSCRLAAGVHAASARAMRTTRKTRMVVVLKAGHAHVVAARQRAADGAVGARCTRDPTTSAEFNLCKGTGCTSSGCLCVRGFPHQA